MSAPKPICHTARIWLRARLGKGCLAPLTGGTSRLFSAYLHLVECWIHSEDPGVERAIREVLALLQPSEWRLAAEAIAHAGDWSHIPKLWERVKPARAPLFYETDAGRVVEVPV